MENDKKENEAIGQPDSCQKSKQSKGSNKEKPCKKPQQDLNRVLDQKEINYEDIDKDDSLSAEEKINKKNERLKQWQEIMEKKTPKRLSKRKQTLKNQLQPIKDLLNQLITIQNSNKKKKARKSRR